MYLEVSDFGYPQISFTAQTVNTHISLINVEPTLTNFEKFHPPQKKIPPPRLLISLLKCLILLQNLMTIFLTIILSYKTLFYHKNWCYYPLHIWWFSIFGTPPRLFQAPRLLERWEYLFGKKERKNVFYRLATLFYKITGRW